MLKRISEAVNARENKLIVTKHSRHFTVHRSGEKGLGFDNAKNYLKSLVEEGFEFVTFDSNVDSIYIFLDKKAYDKDIKQNGVFVVMKDKLYGIRGVT